MNYYDHCTTKTKLANLLHPTSYLWKELCLFKINLPGIVKRWKILNNNKPKIHHLSTIYNVGVQTDSAFKHDRLNKLSHCNFSYWTLASSAMANDKTCPWWNWSWIPLKEVSHSLALKKIREVLHAVIPDFTKVSNTHWNYFS